MTLNFEFVNRHEFCLFFCNFVSGLDKPLNPDSSLLFPYLLPLTSYLCLNYFNSLFPA
jgi:hypothetical protein